MAGKKKKVQKSIDLNQFPHDSRGYVSWKDSIGIVAEFFYDDERHTMEILDLDSSNEKLTVKIDDDIIITSNTQSIKYLRFQHIFYKPDYLYDVNDVVNNLLILERFHRKTKLYKCRCLKDGYEFVSDEYSLSYNRGCPVCADRVIIIGVNDLATTHPDVACLLVNKEEVHKCTHGSNKKVLAKCPICGTIKEMRISCLVEKGLSCNKCSDGISYPNKFAYELFSQLSSQYVKYEPEYSPDWAGRLRYDNYIMLKDGCEIIVEMDGGFHYPEHYKNEKHVHQFNYKVQNDKKKDILASLHNIILIRVNCNYVLISNRFDHIKNNMISALDKYFDLSNIDWNACGIAAVSNRVLDVSKYYMEHKYASLQDVADYFHIHKESVRQYLKIGNEIGLCIVAANDPNRLNRHDAIAVYDPDGNLIDIFRSMRKAHYAFKDKGFSYQCMLRCSKENKSYKNYMFKRIPSEKYDEYHSKIKKAI